MSAADAGTSIEKLPLLTEVLGNAARRGRCVVADLAPASPAGIALFNDLHCRVEILDLPTVLPALAGSANPQDFRQRLESLIRLHPAHPPSVVLCWDFLNYLPREAISELLAHLTTGCHAGVQVHALIAYSSEQMPARPCRYRPAGPDSVHVSTSQSSKPCPRYTPKDLLRSLPDFEIGRAMLLRNGYQEYILRTRQPVAANAPQTTPKGTRRPVDADRTRAPHSRRPVRSIGVVGNTDAQI